MINFKDLRDGSISNGLITNGQRTLSEEKEKYMVKVYEVHVPVSNLILATKRSTEFVGLNVKNHL